MLWKIFRRLKRDQPGEPQARETEKMLGIGPVIRNRYRVDAELGRGGIGIVYRAHDLANDRDVALKVLNPKGSHPLVREQFLREGHIASQLDHPNIVRVYETGTTGDETGSIPFIAMELVQGKSLEDLREPTCSRIADLGRQICSALEYIHGKGFVHRDLKPQNVLLERRGFRTIAKLADLGLARPRGIANLPTEGVAGTVYYLAPEVIAGQPPDAAADLYALGVMLYELVTGRVPFSDYDEETILSQHLNESVIPPSRSRPGMPPDLESVILRLLAKDPRQRFHSAAQVCEALGQVAARAEEAPPTNLPSPAANADDYDSESAIVIKLLESSRLVTLVGSRDVKRNGLAITVGTRLIRHFRDGVWFVELPPSADPGLPLQAVAQVFGVSQEAERSLVVSLTAYLSEKNLLLIFQHCDGLAGACAQLAETIKNTCPEVWLLATACEPLNIFGEQVYPVLP